MVLVRILPRLRSLDDRPTLSWKSTDSAKYGNNTCLISGECHLELKTRSVPKGSFAFELNHEFDSPHLFYDLLQGLHVAAGSLASPCWDYDLGELAAIGQPDCIHREYPVRI